jgi:HAD superfamily hydrolase (TIGR01549 family)
MNLNEYDTIILDCDGVIFNSNYLKLDAFRDAIDSYDQNIIDDFIEYFKKSFGTSRYVLTRVFIEDFLKLEFDEELYNIILDKYSNNCVSLYQKVNTTYNFLEFIEKYQNKQLYIASGSDEEELKLVFRNRNLDKYFKNIFGSPKSKSDIVKDIVDNKNKFIMIGDAKSDMLAAKDSKINFIFMKDYSTNEEMKKDNSLKTINNLGNLI